MAVSYYSRLPRVSLWDSSLGAVLELRFDNALPLTTFQSSAMVSSFYPVSPDELQKSLQYLPYISPRPDGVRAKIFK